LIAGNGNGTEKYLPDFIKRRSALFGRFLMSADLAHVAHFNNADNCHICAAKKVVSATDLAAVRDLSLFPKLQQLLLANIARRGSQLKAMEQ